MRGVRLVYQFSLLILVGLVLWNFGSGAASAQVLLGGQDLERSITAESLDEELENLSRRTTQALDRGGASSEEFYALRRELIELRERAVAREAALSPIVGNIERRLDALGPPPEEGAAEDAPTGGLRADLSVELDRAKAPVLAAQDAARRIDGLVAEIDWEFLARISAPLVSRYPLPILPGNWVQGLNDLQKEIIELANVTVSELADPTVRRTVLERLPIRAVLLAAGLALVITLRRWLNAWIDAQLNRTRDRRSETLLVALRGINRIVLPTAGALLLFAALDPAGLAGGTVIRGPLDLPNWVWALIGAGWLSGSLFAPRTPSHRIPPFDDATARQGAKLVMALGVVLALGAASLELTFGLALSPAAAMVVMVPPVLAGSVLLWRKASYHRRIEGMVLTQGDVSPDAPPHIVRSLIRLLRWLLILFAFAAPIHALLGYVFAGYYMVFPSILTLGLIGAGVVVFDLLNKTIGSFLSPASSGHDDRGGGLTPVILGALVFLAGLPLLAMIWGARPTDIADVWRLLRDGTTVGGVTLSLNVILTLILTFVAIVLVTRLFQALLRSAVLPRTRLDVGAREAIDAGTGYAGVTIAALAAVGAAGLDLSNLALVAGALSVGIGFGLQTIVSNIISGVILLIERPIKQGDRIEVAGFSGYVRGIRVRSTEIETFDRESVLVPNADLIAGTVLNRTHTGLAGRLTVPVGVAYESDPRQMERILLNIAEAHPLVLQDPPVAVLFMGFGDSAMDFEIRCRLRDVNYVLSVRSDLNFEVVERFRAAGITIPFPQRDVHLIEAEAPKGALPDTTHWSPAIDPGRLVDECPVCQTGTTQSGSSEAASGAFLRWPKLVRVRQSLAPNCKA